MSNKKKLVMIGNGMAGVRAIEEILEANPDMFDITIFGAEKHPNYNRILLSPVLAGDMELEDIILNDEKWYADNGISLHLGIFCRFRTAERLTAGSRRGYSWGNQHSQAHRCTQHETGNCLTHGCPP